MGQYRLKTDVGLCQLMVVAWLSGSALFSINEVALRWAQLVLGWVTLFGGEQPV